MTQNDQKIRILFVCGHNSARSQMAETIMRDRYGDRFEPESAGLKTKPINPLAIAAMDDYGLDIRDNSTDRVFDFYQEGRLYDYVITVCSREASEQCPVFPGIRKRLHWPFDDPEGFAGSEEERIAQTIAVRKQIEEAIDAFARSIDER